MDNDKKFSFYVWHEFENQPLQLRWKRKTAIGGEIEQWSSLPFAENVVLNLFNLSNISEPSGQIGNEGGTSDEVDETFVSPHDAI